MLVRKRDGRLAEFDPFKILESIKKASLAVECKDNDLQERARQVMNIKKQLIASGFDPDEAEEQAESQFEGYIENGEYTEYDEDEANDVVELVVESLDTVGEEVVDSSLIQDIVEKALMDTGHTKTAKEYIIHRSNRERIREMNTSLMKSYEDLTFGKSSDVETKRENANIDGDSAMGTMLKYGSEGAKMFNLLYVVPPDQSRAHSSGDIHIHDLDFLALTQTCVSKDTALLIKDDKGTVKSVKAEYFDHYLGSLPDNEVVELSGLSILSKGKFVKLINCVRHPSSNKKILKIKTLITDLTVTSEHRIPIICNDSDDTSEIVVQADTLKTGDKLMCDSFEPNNPSNRKESLELEITGIEVVEGYTGYVYDFETENHYFSANGITVHNCCQIDLEKLFTDGFNTGNGFLREPGEIRSYAALACIAIQANQNDMHKRIA